MEARLKNQLSATEKLEANKKEVEISNSLLRLKIQTFTKQLSKEKSKHLEQVDIQEIFSLWKIHRNPSNISNYKQNSL